MTACRVVQKATVHAGLQPEEAQPQASKGRHPHAVAPGHLGGLEEGKARAAKMTPEQGREIARKAALARWNK